MRTRWLLAASLGTSALAWLGAAEAQACGGTFCDSALPGQQSVDPTGETILFALDGDFVEAHVQIEYDGGDATQFAWFVPLPDCTAGTFCAHASLSPGCRHDRCCVELCDTSETVEPCRAPGITGTPFQNPPPSWENVGLCSE